MSFIHHVEDGGYYELTKSGYIGLTVLIIAAIAVAAVLVSRKQSKENSFHFDARVLAFVGVSIALAFATSYIKFELPMGGSITLFSMFFICYIGYLYGVKVGFVTAFAYSLLAFMQTGGTYFLTPFQVCCDYFFAFTALGVSAFWSKKKNGLMVGYIVACLVRGLFHTIGGYMYWMDYMPEWFPQSIKVLYSPFYNYSYIVAEMIITILVLSIPAVKKALAHIENTYAYTK